MKDADDRITGLRLFGVLFCTAFLVALWVHEEELGWLLHKGTDSLGYYQWLPAILLEGRLDAMPWVHVLDNGNGLSLFNIGVAVLLLPFFLAGHLWALATGSPADGFSAPYCVAQFAAAACYLALGGLLSYGVLRRYHAPAIAFWTILLLYGGTNLLYYASYEPGMSHVYSFFLFAWVWHLTEAWIGKPRPALLAGLVAALTLIVLVRPLNAIAVLIPLCYRARGWRDALGRWYAARGMRRGLLASATLVMVLVVPQLAYWHAVTGRWILFTYGTKGESFDFRAPHLFDVLVSHQNGWFVYTPLMLPVLAALLLAMRKAATGARTVFAVWSLAWYFYGSWWAWWLGAAFGFRGFIDYYALLALPLAALVARVRSSRSFWRKAAITVALFLVFLNIRLSVVYSSPWDGPDWTWERYGHELARALFLEK